MPAIEVANQHINDTGHQIAQIRTAMQRVEQARVAYAIAVLQLKLVTREAQRHG
jgi:hypothetical protein